MKLPAQTILLTTDLSPIGDGAVDMAFTLAGPGATVHLLYVNEPAYVMSPVDATVLYASALTPEERDKVETKVKAHLRHIVPEEALVRGIRVEHHVVHDSGAAAVIEREAKRLGAEVIVLGTHGRTGLKKALLGSVAQEVMKKSKIPVVLVHDAPTRG
jgi:nucleotide-binding universal stress UspA family protein